MDDPIDPCPCGSGRAEERCCSTPLTDPELHYTEEERERALHKVATLLKRPTMVRQFETASALFWLDVEPEVVEELMTDERLMDCFGGLVQWDLDAFGVDSIARLLLAESSKRLTRGERAYLRAGLASHWALYEVRDVRAGVGIVLEDLWRKERIWLREPAASNDVAPLDLIAGRVLKSPRGPHEFEVDVLFLDPATKEELLSSMQAELAELRAETPDLDEHTFFKTLVPTFVQSWIAALEDSVQVQTEEGDELCLSTAYFEVRDRDRLVRALDLAEDFERIDHEEWRWRGPDDSVDRHLGTVRLADDELYLQTLSVERAERASDRVEELAGESVRFLEIEVDSDPEDEPDEPR